MKIKPRFLVIEEIIVSSGRAIFEVVEDDGHFTSHGFFLDEGDAEIKADILEIQWMTKDERNTNQV